MVRAIPRKILNSKKNIQVGGDDDNLICPSDISATTDDKTVIGLLASVINKNNVEANEIINKFVISDEDKDKKFSFALIDNINGTSPKLDSIRVVLKKQDELT